MVGNFASQAGEVFFGLRQCDGLGFEIGPSRFQFPQQLAGGIDRGLPRGQLGIKFRRPRRMGLVELRLFFELLLLQSAQRCLAIGELLFQLYLLVLQLGDSLFRGFQADAGRLVTGFGLAKFASFLVAGRPEFRQRVLRGGRFLRRGAHRFLRRLQLLLDIGQLSQALFGRGAPGFDFRQASSGGFDCWRRAAMPSSRLRLSSLESLPLTRGFLAVRLDFQLELELVGLERFDS